MTTERIDIIVTEQGARTVKANIDAIADSAKGAQKSFDNLKALYLKNMSAMDKLHGQAMESDKRMRGVHYSQVFKAHGTALEMEKNLVKKYAAEMEKAHGSALELEKNRRRKFYAEIDKAHGQALEMEKVRVQKASAEINRAHGAALEMQKNMDKKAVAEMDKLHGNALAEDSKRRRRAIDDMNKAHGQALEMNKKFNKKLESDTAITTNRIGSLWRTMAGAFGLNEVRKAADEYTSLQNKLRALGVAQSDLGKTTERLVDISNKSFTSVEATATLYARLIPATKELGASQDQLYTFTQAAAQSMTLWGTGAGTAKGAMLQLSQAMSGARIRAQEFNSIQDGMYPLLQVVAKNIEGVGGSVARLRQRMKDGKLMSKEFFDAAIKGADELALATAKVIPTTVQVGTVFKNAFIVAVGQLNETTGATLIFAKMVHTLAMNLDTLVGAAMAAAVAYGLFTLATVELTLANSALIMSLRANPITAFAAAIAGVTAYLYAAREEISYFGDDITSLGDMFSVLGDKVSGILNGIVGIELGEIRPPSFVDFLNSFAMASDKVETVFTQLGFMINAIIDGAMQRLEVNLNRASARIENIGIRLANVGRSSLDAQALVPVPEKFDFGAHMQAASLNMPVVTRAQDSLSNFNREVRAKGIARGESEMLARNFAEDDKLTAPPSPDLPKLIDPKELKKAETEAKKFATSLEKIRDKYDGVYKAQSEMTESTKILDRALGEKKITLEQHDTLLAQMTQELKDQADPIGAINRELDEQSKLLGMTTKEQEAFNQVKKITEDLIGKGISQAQIENAQFEDRIRNIQKESEASQIRNQILDATINKEAELYARRAVADSMRKGSAQEQLAIEKDYVTQNADLLETETQTKLRHIEERRKEFEASSKGVAGKEAEYAKGTAELDKQVLDVRLGQASEFFGGMSSLMQSKNKKMFEIGKAAAIASAMIDTYKMATGAFTAMASIPYVGPVLGAAAAAAAIAAGMANVANIRSQQMPAFAHGGSMTVGGVGGTDSQVVSFRATPGETVLVKTPSQESEEARRNKGGGNVFNISLPNITKESEARASVAQVQRGLATVTSNAQRYR